MSPLIVSLVLLAAILHATWNALAKSGGSPALSIASYQLVGALACLLLIGYVEIPAPASWPYILASVIIHNIYYGTLAMAYRSGDLSLVYPIFRGLAPVMVAAGASWFYGETLPAPALAGVLLISAGLITIPLLGPRKARPTKAALGWGLATSILIACYTITDGIGVRESGAPTGYIVWLFLFEPLPIGLWLLIRYRSEWPRYMQQNFGGILFGGLASSAAYGLIIYAMSLGAMALVSSLRETSVIFAALIGTLFLKEPFGRQRVLAACLVAVGVIVIRYFG